MRTLKIEQASKKGKAHKTGKFSSVVQVTTGNPQAEQARLPKRTAVHRDAQTGRFIAKSDQKKQKITIEFTYLTAEEVEKNRCKAYQYLL